MTGVRFRDGEGFEGKCESCLEWWPIDGDFWDTDRGFRLCRACHRERIQRLKAVQRRDPEYVAAESRAWKAWYEDNKETARAAHARRQRIRYQTDPEFRAKRLAASKAYAAANRERRRAYCREWYRRHYRKAA